MNTQYESEARSVEHRPISKAEEAELLIDERWLLVRRILATSGFQRADQLRKILLYTTRLAILRPEKPIREYEIACNILGRRFDFNPGSDNIVRVQVSHLRRKLEAFYALEGTNEHIRLTIPRGGYSAAFEYVAPAPRTNLLQPEATCAATLPPPAPSTDDRATAAVDSPQSPSKRPWTRREITLLAALCNTIILLIVLYHSRFQPVIGNKTSPTVATNPLLTPLLSNHKSISIVLPDTSLMVVQNLLSQNVSVGDYLTKFPQQLLSGVSDPALHHALTYLSSKRNTSFSEASVAINLIQNLSRFGASVHLRYARDLHVNDFGENNLVIFGSTRSDPWASMFADKTNFRFVQNPDDHEFGFINARPHPGEQARYIPENMHNDRQIDYIDVAMLPNITNSGYVLLFTGSDAQSNQAAVRYVLGGALSEQLSALRNKNPTCYEFFLRGTHVVGEAEDHFEMVATRFPGK